MTKVDILRLDSVTNNDTTATSTINTNFQAIQEAMENTLSRDGSTPNFMDADLDMNSYKIINAGDPENDSDVITKGWFDQYVDDAAGASATAVAAADRAEGSAQAAQTAAAQAAIAAGQIGDNVRLSRDWAIKMDGTVDGVDYSSKYYASQIIPIASDITTVSGIATDIGTVATDIANINAVAADLTNIDNASQYVAEAKQWAIGSPSEPTGNSAKYWAQQAAGQVIPSQTGHSGEFLTTDGTALSWDTVDALPSQTGQSGKYLTTDGTDASWATLSVNPDNKSITKNASDELQTIGVINQNDTTTALKTWSGTKAQYEAIVTKNASTEYFCTDSGELYLGDVKIGSGSGLEIGDIGIAPLGIDETENKRRYLNGQVISQAQFVSFTDKLKSIVALYPNLATTEVNWQAEVTNSKLGQCGKFVIDDVAGTIRLPKVVNINGLQDLTALGGIKAESLPNIKGTFDFDSDGNKARSKAIFLSGAFTNTATSSIRTSGNTVQANQPAGVSFDASLSSSTYQDNAPVQQEAVQYPYFIQVATGVETSIDVSREIELNNPFSLLDYKYSEYELSNASWLLSNGQWNSGAVYQSVYDLLLSIYNGTTTKAGVSVKLSTETYVDTDFVINTADTTFRLPLKVALASGNKVAGNGMTLGLTDGTNNFSINTSTNSQYSPQTMNSYGQLVGTSSSGSYYLQTDTLSIGVTTDETKSGIETSANGLYLYFYVGEVVQDANIIAAGQALTDIADLKNASNFSQTGLSTLSGLGMPSGRYDSLTVGASGSNYTAPANGWFYLRKVATAANQYVNFNVNGALIANYVAVSTFAVSTGYLPVRKGDILKVDYNLGGTTSVFRFVYAEGEK